MLLFVYVSVTCIISELSLELNFVICFSYPAGFDYVGLLIKYFYNFTEFLLFVVMAGLAPEGTQFDARQYDAKMNEL